MVKSSTLFIDFCQQNEFKLINTNATWQIDLRLEQRLTSNRADMKMSMW